MSRLLGVFVKQPVPGQVKTRLGAAVGPESAARLYAAFVEDLAERFASVADERWLVFAPEENAAAAWTGEVGLGAYECLPQSEGDLGQRIETFFELAFAQGARRVVLIGSDSPTLPRSLVERAFDDLAETDVVLGPATDGGYYLIGQRDSSRDLFGGVEWSSSSVLEQTLSRVADSGATLSVLPVWYDVDTIADLHLLRGHLLAMAYADSPTRAARTSEALADQFGSGDVP